MATAFKKPNLNQSVKTPEPIAETQSFDDLWSGEVSEASNKTGGEASDTKLYNDHFDSDKDALANLHMIGIVYDGGIIQLFKGTEYPPEILNACDYLCNEWDYGLSWIEVADADYPSQDPEAMAEMTGEETAVKEAIEQATEEGNARDENWSEADQVELGLVAEPVTAEPTFTETLTTESTEAIRRNEVEQHSYTEADSLLDEIENAEKDCAQAEAEVDEIKSSLKRAKKRYDNCVEHLRELARQVREDNNRPLLKQKPVTPAAPAPTVAFAATTEATDVAPDSGQVVSDSTCDLATEEALPDWQTIKLAALEQHGVSVAVIEKLAENQINTLGELESLRAEISQGKAKWPKGIGEKKITAIENAVVTLLAAHQYSDSATVPVTQVDEVGGELASDSATTDEDDEPQVDASTDPTPKEWEAMSHGEQLAWLNARCVYLEDAAKADTEMDAIDVLDYRNTDSETEWQEGVDSYSEDDTASNCPYGPGENCDAWLQGWLWAAKQDTFDTSLPPK